MKFKERERVRINYPPDTVKAHSEHQGEEVEIITVNPMDSTYHIGTLANGSTKFVFWIKEEHLALFAPEENKADYPHKCPHCGSPAYIGLMKVECSKGCQ